MTAGLLSTNKDAISNIMDQIAHFESCGKTVKKVCIKLLYEYPSLLHPLTPSSYKINKIENLILVNAPESKMALEGELGQKFFDSYLSLEKVSSVASFRLDCGLRLSDDKLLRFDLTLDESPLCVFSDKLIGNRAFGPRPEVAESSGLAIGPRVCYGHYGMTNQTLDSLDPRQLGYLIALVIQECLEAVKRPLTLAELASAFDIASDPKWSKGTGICSGLSDVFNAFCLRHSPTGVDIFKHFKNSEEFAMAPAVQIMPYHSIKDFFKIEEGMVEKNASKHTHRSHVWPQMQKYFEIHFPELELSSPQQLSKIPLLEEIESIDPEFVELFSQLGIEIENLNDQSEIAKAFNFCMQTVLNPRNLSAIRLDRASLYRLLDLVTKRKALSERLYELENRTLDETLKTILDFSSHHESFACKLSYYTLDHTSGHAISLYVSQSSSMFVYFDSNYGVEGFATLETLLDYFAVTHTKHKQFVISFMTKRS